MLQYIPGGSFFVPTLHKRQKNKPAKQLFSSLLFLFDEREAIPYGEHYLLYPAVILYMLVKSMYGFCIFAFRFFTKHLPMKKYIVCQNKTAGFEPLQS